MLKQETEDMLRGVIIKFQFESILNFSRLWASTKVTEALVIELLFPDDCMLTYPKEPDLQYMAKKFSDAVKTTSCR